MEDALEDEPVRHSLDKLFYNIMNSNDGITHNDKNTSITSIDLESGNYTLYTHNFPESNDYEKLLQKMDEETDYKNTGHIRNSASSVDNTNTMNLRKHKPKNKKMTSNESHCVYNDSSGNQSSYNDTNINTNTFIGNDDDDDDIETENQKGDGGMVDSLVNDIVDTGSLDIMDNFSDKYAIILGLTLYDYYFFNIRYPLEILLLLALFIVLVNIIRYLIEYHTTSLYVFSPKIGRSRRYVSFWSFVKDTCVNISGALVVIEVKLFTLIIHRLLIDQYDKNDVNLVIILFVIPFLILKSLPLLVYWFSQLSLYDNTLVNDTDIQFEQKKIDKNARLIIPHIGDFFGNFSEKYSLLLALDLYDYITLSADSLLVEYFSVLFILLCVLCILRSSILILTHESPIKQKLFWEFLENIIKYAIQLLVILEIRYFGTKICSYAQNIAEGSPGNYHLLLLFWLPIVAIKSIVTVSNWIKKTQDIVVTSIDGINDLLDAFLDKYVLLISFDIYHVIKHQKRVNSLELLSIVLAMNIFSYILQSCFLFLQSKHHLNFIILWRFWVDLFTYYTHVTALICLKLFTVITQSALNESIWNITIVLLLAPFLVIRIVPILLQTIHANLK